INIELANTLLKWDYFCGIFIGLFLHLFCFNFPKPNRLFNRISIILYIPAVILAIFSLKGFVISNARFINENLVYDFGPLYSIFGLIFIAYFISGITSLVLKLRKASGKTRHQIFYVLFGLFLSATIGIIVNVILQPMLNLPKEIVQIGIWGILFLVGLSSYAMIKHELMDIKAVISRLAAYLTVLFLFTVNVTIIFQYFPAPEIITVAFGFIWIVFGNRLREKIQTSAEKKWLTDWYDPTEIINEISIKLSSLLNRKEIISTAAEIINNYIPVKGYLLCFADINIDGNINNYQIASTLNQTTNKIQPDNGLIIFISKQKQPIQYHDLPKEIKKHLSDLNVTKGCILLPLRSQHTLEGIIILGKRSSELSYNEKDIKLFVTVIDIISVYLERTLPYEKIKNEYSKTLEAAEKMSYQAALSSLNLGITHEINNPLMILQTSTDYMNELLEDRKTKSVVNKLSDALGNTEAEKILKGLNTKGYLDDKLHYSDDFGANYIDKEIELSHSFDQDKEKIQSIIFSDYLDKSIIKYFSVVDETIDRILMITDTMLKHGKAESEEKEVVSIVELLKDFQTMYESTCKKKKVQLVIKPADEKALIHCEKIRMNQLLLNMARNAVQAMEDNPEGRDRVLSISVSNKSFINKQDKKINGVEIIISDTGTGIPNEYINKIFDPFFTYGKQKSEGANTGLGLAIVLKIIEDHGGIITVESKVDEGSIFRILLPVADN
ncbi:ATP-binding protein, partial [Candidatus Margulisiibacteriota bacterium]